VAERGELAEESFLTVAEVADMLKLNQQTVRNWIDQGSLRALRVGRRVRIKRSDLERMLEESYRAGTAVSTQPTGPSAEDFWGGEAVGIAEPADLVHDAGPERSTRRDERAPVSADEAARRGDYRG
jgi:excisionase family DNA binding protein